MLPTYKATLKGNRLEWLDEAPRYKDGVRVQVTMLEEATKNQGEQMARVLAEIAETGGLASIEDPKTWQRAQRVDRERPERSS